MNPFRLGLLAPLSPLLCAQTVPAPQLIGFPIQTIEAHRLSGSATLTVAAARVPGYAGSADIRVTIGTDGKVVDVRDHGTDRRFSDPAPAIAAARGWRFRPFEYRGRPVRVVANMSVNYRLPAAWANPRAGFPRVDYATLRIELARAGCLGTCPVYTVSIAGDGTVTYVAGETSDPNAVHPMQRGGVVVLGEHRAQIDRAALDGLIAKFRAAHFFGLKREYVAGVTDNPYYRLRFSTGGKSRDVVDYVGQMVDMPEVVTALEDEVDRVAGSARWVRGDATTLATLRAEGFDPRSSDAATLARAALQRGGDAFVLDLLAAGLPLDLPVKPHPDMEALPLGRVLFVEAVSSGRPLVAQALADRGWLARIPAAERAALFAETAAGCDPALARAFIRSGIDPNARAPRLAEGWSKGGGTALYAAGIRYGICGEKEGRAAMIKALVALGVDPNLPDARGRTPIYEVDDADLLALLLASGARADVKDENGNSPVFSSYVDLHALMLLDAGADPRGSVEGKTLPMLAKTRDLPATAAWLAAHGIR